MNLSGDDLLVLIPHLQSDDHILAYDLPRFAPHFPQQLHRVRWLAASIVDSVLGEGAVDPKILRSDDKDARARHLATLVEKAKAMGTTTDADHQEAKLVAAKGDREIQAAMFDLRMLDAGRAARALAKRAKDAPARSPEWLRVLV